MDIRKAFATDKRAETEGRKLVLAPAANGKPEAFLLIARKGNANYKAFTSKAFQENQTALSTKTPEAEALATRMFKEAAARTLLIGWGGIDWTGADGVEQENVPYSAELALTMFEAADDFYQLVDKYASEMSNYRAEEVAKDAKNSATS
jgi:hypothetical protein